MAFLDEVLKQPGPGLPPVQGDPGYGPAGLCLVLARFRYKRGWRFEVGPNEAFMGRPDGWRSPYEWCLKITSAPVEDARGSGVTSPVITVVPLPYLMPDTEGDWVRWLWHQVCQAELHEAGEWFVVGDGRPYDPH